MPIGELSRRLGVSTDLLRKWERRYAVLKPGRTIGNLWNRMIESWGDAASLDYWAPSAAHDPELREWWTRWVRPGASRAMRAIGRHEPVESRMRGDTLRPVVCHANDYVEEAGRAVAFALLSAI